MNGGGGRSAPDPAHRTTNEPYGAPDPAHRTTNELYGAPDPAHRTTNEPYGAPDPDYLHATSAATLSKEGFRFL